WRRGCDRVEHRGELGVDLARTAVKELERRDGTVGRLVVDHRPGRGPRDAYRIARLATCFASLSHDGEGSLWCRLLRRDWLALRIGTRTSSVSRPSPLGHDPNLGTERAGNRGHERQLRAGAACR